MQNVRDGGAGLSLPRPLSCRRFRHDCQDGSLKRRATGKATTNAD
jgi:hypothetical protein